MTWQGNSPINGFYAKGDEYPNTLVIELNDEDDAPVTIKIKDIDLTNM